MTVFASPDFGAGGWVCDVILLVIFAFVCLAPLIVHLVSLGRAGKKARASGDGSCQRPKNCLSPIAPTSAVMTNSEQPATGSRCVSWERRLVKAGVQQSSWGGREGNGSAQGSG